MSQYDKADMKQLMEAVASTSIAENVSQDLFALLRKATDRYVQDLYEFHRERAAEQEEDARTSDAGIKASTRDFIAQDKNNHEGIFADLDLALEQSLDDLMSSDE